MKGKKTVAGMLASFFMLTNFASAYALDWKRLHEQADKTDLSQALLISEKPLSSAGDVYVAALVFLNFHKDKEANEAFERVLRISPGRIEAGWGIAEVLRRQHKLDESREALDKVLQEDPEFTPACISLAYIKYTQRDFNGAVQAAYKVIRQGKSSTDLSNFTRALLIVAGAKGTIAHFGGPISKIINGAAVFSYLRKAQNLQPDSPAVLLGLGSFYLLAPAFAGGNIDKAKEYLEKAVSVDPLLSDAYARLAQVFEKQGKKDKFQEYLKRALAIDPENELALDIKNGTCLFICVKDISE